MHALAIEKELRASTRQFASVQHALRWYAEQRSLRSGQAIPLQRGSGPRSQELIDESHATYARIVSCLRVRDDEDLDEEILLFPRRIAALLAWYTPRAPWVADEHGMKKQQFDRYCGYTETVVRRRMRARRLLEE